MDRAEARKILRSALKAHGLKNQRRFWILEGEGLRWMLEIDSPPKRTSVLGVQAGLEFWFEDLPKGANYCPLILYLDSHKPLGEFPSEMWDLRQYRFSDAERTPFPDELRVKLFGQFVGAAVTYLGRLSDTEAVRAAYWNGDFQGSFIHKSLRSVLESDDPFEFDMEAYREASERSEDELLRKLGKL